MTRLRRITRSATLAVAAGLTLAACTSGDSAPDVDVPVDLLPSSTASASVSASPSAEPEASTPAPSGDTNVVLVDPPTAGERYIPPDTQPYPQLYPVLENVGDVAASEAQEAWLAAGGFAEELLFEAAVWHAGTKEAGTAESAYMKPSTMMTDDAASGYLDDLYASGVDNPDAEVAGELLAFPAQIDGQWMLPAVEFVRWSAPELTDVSGSVGGGKNAVNVSFTVHGVGVYTRDGKYFQVPVSRDMSLDMMQSKNRWRIAGWDNGPVRFGKATVLSEKPEERTDPS